MSPEERELLNRSVILGEENNIILRSLRRSQRVSHLVTLLYWVLIVGSAVGGYYLLQPYVDQVVSVYNTAKSTLNNFGSVLQNVKK